MALPYPQVRGSCNGASVHTRLFVVHSAAVSTQPISDDYSTAGAAAREGLIVGISMAARLSLILVPAGFLVFLLEIFGALEPLAALLDPVMALAGLPGEAALVFATGALVTIYPAIGIMASLTFSPAETTVIALMILICHNLFVETAVQARIGSNPVRIVLVRVLTALLAGVIVGRLLGLNADIRSPDTTAAPGFPGWETTVSAFVSWAGGTGRTVLTIVVLVTLLMVGQRLLRRSGVLPRIARFCEPVVRVFGLPRQTAFLWLVGNTLGLTYGAAVILEERDHGDLTADEADLLNHHLAVSHSLLEDTLLFVAIGASVTALIIPRLLAAMIVVWVRRLAQNRVSRVRSARRPKHD